MNGGPDDQAPDDLKGFYARHGPLLRRLNNETESVQRLTALLCDKEPTSEHTAAVELRLACLELLADYVSQWMGRSGGQDIDRFHNLRVLEVALSILGGLLHEDRQGAGTLEAEARRRGVALDATRPGGGTKKPDRRGRPPDLLTAEVRRLLEEWFPESWGEEGEFTESDSQALRERLREALTRDPLVHGESWVSGESWAEGLHAYPFSPDDIDPASGGPLSKIIQNLRRMQ